MQAVASHFLLPVSESWGEEEIRDVVEAIRKVVNAFAV
jgi:uncharacterized protein YktA (UPF0223 family)